MLSVSYAGYQIPGSPFRVMVHCDEEEAKKTVSDASKVVSVGSGMTTAVAHSMTEFILDGCGNCKIILKLYILFLCACMGKLMLR